MRLCKEGHYVLADIHKVDKLTYLNVATTVHSGEIYIWQLDTMYVHSYYVCVMIFNYHCLLQVD